MRVYLPACILVSLFCAVFLPAPAGAVIVEDIYIGTITLADPVNHTLTISVTHSFGCHYVNGTAVCNYDPVTPPRNLTGPAPDPLAVTYCTPGMHVEAVQAGGENGTWVSIGTIVPGKTRNSWYALTQIGDPGHLTIPLAGNYEIETRMVPDCGSCRGTVCNAKSVNITLKSENMTVAETPLLPGGTYQYNGRNDNSSVSVLFVEGEAPSSLCPDSDFMTGPQPFSDFIITVQPPIGFDTFTGNTGGNVTEAAGADSTRPSLPTRNFLEVTTRPAPLPWILCTVVSMITALWISKRGR